MELQLDRPRSYSRFILPLLFPSGTDLASLLMDKDEMQKMWLLRKIPCRHESHGQWVPS
jgi:transcription termination factor Rho